MITIEQYHNIKIGDKFKLGPKEIFTVVSINEGFYNTRL